MRITLDTPPRGVAGRLAQTVFGLLFAGIGLFVGALFARQMIGQFDLFRWPATECRIVDSRLDERPGAEAADEQYRFVVRYLYRDAAGVERTGDRVAPSYSGSSDIESAAALLRRYPIGATVPCFVDPANGEYSTLRRPRPYGAFFLLVPALFVLAGLGIALAAWRGARSETRGRALSSRSSRQGGAGCLAAFFGAFLLFGLAALAFTVRPLVRVATSSGWREAPARILHSGVREHSGDDGATYSVEVLYEYRVGAETYRASRYDFFSGSSSGREAKEAVVATLPPGTETVCRYDPDHPERAVLDRRFKPIYLLFLLPLVFVAIGGGGLLFGLRAWRRRSLASSTAESRPDWLPDSANARAAFDPAFGAEGDGPLDLEPTASPLGRLLGMTFVALFWNGIVSVFVVQAVHGWRAGQGDGCLTAFLVPFVAIGLALVASVPYQALALANPRPHLTLSTRRLRPGEPARLSWRFSGRPGRMSRLTIALEGREEATYRRGTNTSTEREVFARVAVFESTQPATIAVGEAVLALPADAMHSFAAGHNKVVWTLKIAGEIARWPDVAEDFELAVLPARKGAGGREWTGSR